MATSTAPFTFPIPSYTATMLDAVRQQAKAYVAGAVAGEISEDELIDRTLLINVSDKYSLSALCQMVIDTEDATREKDLEILLILLSCLQVEKSMREIEMADVASIEKLSIWISGAILPDGSLMASDEAPENISQEAINAARILRRHAALAGLTILSIILSLQRIRSAMKYKPDPKVMRAVVAYSSYADPWSTPVHKGLAELILTPYQAQVVSGQFIYNFVLHETVKLLFGKLSSITPAGRQNAFASTAPPPKYNTLDTSRVSKPWKYDHPYAITVYEWAIKHIPDLDYLPPDYLALAIPPLLTLLDDNTTSVIIRGLEILPKFLLTFQIPSKTLQQTGLDYVLEEAILTKALYLPSITPIAESNILLPAVYSALWVLYIARYPTNKDPPAPEPTSEKEIQLITATPKEDETETLRLAFLDRVMRQALLPTWTHCPEYPSITTILLLNLSLAFSKMGIHSVKYLQTVLSILSTILSDPFSLNHKHLILEALQCLGIIMQNSWPRIGIHQHGMEIIRMIGICWCNVDRANMESKKDERAIRGEIRRVGRLFKEGSQVDLSQLIVASGGLKEVFG